MRLKAVTLLARCRMEQIIMNINQQDYTVVLATAESFLNKSIGQ